jgi:hypothetical protein
MPDFIITKSDFEQVAQNQSPIPAGSELKCRSKASIFRTLNANKDADGILIRIIRRANGKPDIRISKYFKKQDFKNGFVILRAVLEEQILRGSFIVLNIYIYTEPSNSLIIAGSDTPCGQHGGDGGEGVKVRIPT